MIQRCGALGRTVVIGLTVVATLVGVGSGLAPRAARAAETTGPAPGALYEGRRGEARVALLRVGERSGRALVLVHLAPECDGFHPEARLVLTVGAGGAVQGRTSAFDNGTTDSVDATIVVRGTVTARSARLELDISLEAEDNAGPTGDCDEEQTWMLRPHADAGVALVSGATRAPGSLLAVGRDAVLVAETGEGTGPARIRRVDPATMATAWSVEVEGEISELGAGGDAVWAFDEERAVLTRIDAATGRTVATVALETPEAARQLIAVFTPMAVAPDAVWVAIDGPNRLYRVDVATNTVSARVELATPPRALVATTGTAYLGLSTPPRTTGSGRLVRLDAAGREVAAVTVPDDSVVAMALSGADLWAVTLRDTVLRADSATLATRARRADVDVALAPRSLAVASPGVWIPGESGIVGYDSDLGSPVTVPVIGAGFTNAVAGFGSVWVLEARHLVRIRVTS